MKKMLAVLLCLLLAAGLLPAMAEENRVLTVVTWDAATTPYLTAQKEAFEASHPGVTIEYIDISAQDYDAGKPTTMLAAGDTSDVFDVKVLSELQNWIEQGFVESLAPYIEESGYQTDKYVGMEACYQSLDGEQYGLPYRSDFWVLFYNKTLFDAAGVEVPTNDMTWDEYKEIAIQMTSGEGVDKVYGSHYHTWLSDVANWAVCDGVNTLADGEYSDLAYYYQLVQDLEDAGAVMEYSELKASGQHYRGVFGNGNIAMMPMGYWFVSTLINDIADNTANEFEWGITAVPHAEGIPAGSSFGSPTGACINKNSANKDLAWEFIAWRCSEEGAMATASTGTRPAYVSDAVAEAMASAEGFPSDANSLAALLPTAVYIEWPTGEFVNEIKTVVNEEHTSIMTREVSIEEGIENMNTRAAEIMG